MNARKLLPNAVTAQSAGDRWEPELQFTGSIEQDRDRLIALLKKYGSHVEFYFLYYPFPAHYSLELQFFETVSGQRAMRDCRAEYQTWPVDEDEDDEDDD